MSLRAAGFSSGQGSLSSRNDDRVQAAQAAVGQAILTAGMINKPGNLLVTLAAETACSTDHKLDLMDTKVTSVEAKVDSLDVKINILLAHLGASTGSAVVPPPAHPAAAPAPPPPAPPALATPAVEFERPTEEEPRPDHPPTSCPPTSISGFPFLPSQSPSLFPEGKIYTAVFGSDTASATRKLLSTGPAGNGSHRSWHGLVGRHGEEYVVSQWKGEDQVIVDRSKSLHNKHCVQYHDVKIDSVKYLICPRYEKTLAAVKHYLTPQQLSKFKDQLQSGLNALYLGGFYHGDVSPENIAIHTDKSGSYAVWIDIAYQTLDEVQRSGTDDKKLGEVFTSILKDNKRIHEKRRLGTQMQPDYEAVFQGLFAAPPPPTSSRAPTTYRRKR